MSRAVDLNADLGEGCPWDEELLARVTSASVSCGAHAGTPDDIVRTLKFASDRGVVVGAHPGYADPANFGRVDQDLSDDRIVALIANQLDWLDRRAEAAGVAVRFVKPHGALYNQAQRDARVAAAAVGALQPRGLPILGQPGGMVESAARAAGLRFVAEGFADRRYLADGRLAPRTEPGAVLDDPEQIRAQVLALVGRGIETLCVHGDNAHSVAMADLVLGALRDAGVAVRGFA